MKRLQEYVFENIVNIFEAHFKDSEFICGSNQIKDYHYAIAVINDIKNGNRIKLGDKNTGPFYWLKINIDLTSQLDDLLKRINANQNTYNIKASEFNEIFKTIKKDSYTIYTTEDGQEEANNQNIDNLWSKIYKGTYSGKVAASATYGQIFESLVCYIYNYGEDANVEEWANDFKVDNTNISYGGWIKSSQISANLLKKYFKSNYIAYHVDGHDKLNGADKKYLDICKLFSGKEGINEVLGKNDKWNNIYEGSKKDKWNAADIVLVNKNLDLAETLKYFKKDVDGKILNTKLVEYTLNKSILPISLKKIDENGHIYAHNIKSNEEFENDRYNISNVKIQFGKTYETGPDVLSGNFVLDGDTVDIQIRKQASGDNLSIEAKLSSNKNARGGKGISVIKSDLDIKSNEDYYAKLSSNDDIIKNFKAIGIKFEKSDLSDFEKISKKYSDLYKRICYKGFIGLADKWKKEKHKNDNWNNDMLIEFVQYIWDSCTECPGSYYIIK